MLKEAFKIIYKFTYYSEMYFLNVGLGIQGINIFKKFYW